MPARRLLHAWLNPPLPPAKSFPFGSFQIYSEGTSLAQWIRTALYSKTEGFTSLSGAWSMCRALVIVLVASTVVPIALADTPAAAPQPNVAKCIEGLASRDFHL